MVALPKKSYSSKKTDIGKRFRAAVAKRRRVDTKFCIADAAREMGYAYTTNVFAILAGVPGRAGPRSIERIETWIKENS